MIDRRTLALVLGCMLLLTSLPVGAATKDVRRVYGEGRVETAVAVSADGWDGSSYALVATARNFPDALAAGALAATLDAPLLLTEPSSLPPDVGRELERLGATEVIVLGGPAAVADEVLDAIRGLATRPSVRRIAGKTRFQTAVEIAQEAPSPVGEVALALGQDYPDAVSAGALSASPDRVPVLLTDALDVPDITMEALQAMDPSRVWVIGGPAAIDEAVLDEVRDAGFVVERLWGDDRYGTSTVVVEQALGRFPGGTMPLVLATGGDFPDALAAAALAARSAGPVLLVARDALPVRTDDFLRDRASRFSSGVVVGGPAAVSDTTLDAVVEALGEVEGFGDGTWRVPQEVQPGLYRNSDSSRNCFWRRLAGFSGELDDTKASQFTDQITIVEIADDDRGFESDDCGVWSSDLTPRTSSASASFAGGAYLVGDEVGPGVWRNDSSTEGCYWERLTGWSHEPDDLITNQLTGQITIVEISEGDAGFWSYDCGTWSRDLSPRTASPTSDIGGGAYQVGTEMAAGTWRNSDSSAGCYWERLSGWSHEGDGIIANDLTSSQATVDVAESDVGFRSENCGTWTKIG